MENLVQQYLRSGIDVFSHQIYASTFAISNPFVKGFILADEAGLGKSMEALLIISQYYKRIFCYFDIRCMLMLVLTCIIIWINYLYFTAVLFCKANCIACATWFAIKAGNNHA